ncbi:MAG: hypothetical protein ACOVNY_02825 [Chitinophagaceae bacterium]
MKQIIKCSLLIFGVCFFQNSNAKHFPNKTKSFFSQSTHDFDVPKLTQSIVTQLNSSLGLTKDQQPKVTNAITTFLQAKSEIIHLQKTQKEKYQNKFATIQSALKNKLTGILLQRQMDAFEALKPLNSSTSNIFYHLFY